MPLLERKRLLEPLIADASGFATAITSDRRSRRCSSSSLQDESRRHHLQAARSAPYRRNRAAADWVKVKCSSGRKWSSVASPSRRASAAALALCCSASTATASSATGGKVGTGFNEQTLNEHPPDARQAAHRQVAVRQSTDAAPRAGGPLGQAGLVAEIAFTEWSDDGHAATSIVSGSASRQAREDVVRERPKRTWPTARQQAGPREKARPARPR